METAARQYLSVAVAHTRASAVGCDLLRAQKLGAYAEADGQESRWAMLALEDGHDSRDDRLLVVDTGGRRVPPVRLQCTLRDTVSE